MTDNELAAELEFYKGNEDLISPDLISKASERIYALSANCSLLKASLAQAERESEAALSALTANAEPFGYFRCLPLSGWEDCAETDEGAIPLYERPQTDRVAKLEAEVERLRARLAGLVGDIQGLMSESEGVAGLQRNGDVAPWAELETGARFERLSNLPAAAEEAEKEAQS